MPRRKVGLEHIRSIQKMGATYFISIPVNLIRDLEWKERRKVVVSKRGAGLVISDWKPS